MSESRFRIGPEIVHETVDGEVIAIDLANGSYYSIAGSGPAIWELLVRGVGEAEVGTALAGRFEAEDGEIATAVSELLAQLQENGLIVSEAGAAANAPTVSSSEEKAPFEAPRLERYTDMKDYFLLDPIHEVDTAGWPRPAA
ncbi:MAG TPA: PqqD family protein [Solirubrobacterales bacterium]|nr:PqqD family protein [Solirubrobacterales bacterium]